MKPVYYNKLLGESQVRLRRKEVKEGELYPKIDADLQDFLTIDLTNPVYERGFKLVTGCQDKEGSLASVSFMCENTDNCSFESMIKRVDTAKTSVKEDMTEELFERHDPARTSALSLLPAQDHHQQDNYCSPQKSRTLATCHSSSTRQENRCGKYLAEHCSSPRRWTEGN